jgi:hypothetical protein
MVAHDRRSTSTGGVRVRPRLQPDPPKGFIMAAKKQSKSKNGRAKQTLPAAGRFAIVLSTAKYSALNMTAVVATSGSVLLFLLAAKRFS